MLYCIFFCIFTSSFHFLCSLNKREAHYRHTTSVGCCVAAEDGKWGHSGSVEGCSGAVMVVDSPQKSGQSDSSSPKILAPTASPSTPMVALLRYLKKIKCMFFTQFLCLRSRFLLTWFLCAVFLKRNMGFIFVFVNKKAAYLQLPTQ